MVGTRLHITLVGEAAARMRELGGTALLCRYASLDGIEVVVASVCCDPTRRHPVESNLLLRRVS